MTHQPQDDFESCMEHAEAWMKAIQERLRINDNTQGPRSALEARLRETEIICDLEPEGQFKMELVLMKAEALLQETSEDEKHEIQAKLKDIKSMFEETTTYMTHCHSRIEWVWLHWSEYLKARDEFTLWIHNMRLTIEPDVELQLGLKEKQWQYSHAQVLLKDVQNQATLLDRLLEEAAALYNRIGDPSVDEDVQNQMKAEYERIKKKAQERVELLQRIMADHSEYEENVQQFREWLNDVIEKLKGCVGTTSESSVSKLQTFQDIANDVKFGQQKLEELQVQSVSIIVSTSPLGAENIKAEQEELRNALAQLKLMNEEEMESLMKANESESSFQELTKHIEDEIQEFRKVIQTLESNLGTEEKCKNEDQLISLWRQRVATRFALVDEEAREERLKLLLKELFRFSHDVQDTSNSAMAVMREYRSITIKAFKLCTDSESELKQCFQNPLREFHHWKSAIQRVLDATADMTDLPMIQDFSLQIKTLVNESPRLKDRLMMVQLNKDFLSGIFGDQKAETLLNKVVNACKEREALHNSLLQRTLRFQTSASQSEDFDAAFEALQTSLQTIGRKVKENESQPDLVGKETQLQRLQMLHEELLKLEPQFEVLEINDQLSPSHKSKMNQLASERLTVYRSLEIMLKNSRQYVKDHRRLNINLLDLERWMMETRQKLESYQDVNQEQNLDNEERHSERLFAEFPEKEMQLQQVETQGQRVMENSSPDGASHIQSELKQLKTSWEYLLKLLKDLAWLHTKNDFSEIEMDAGKKTIKGNKRMFRSRSYSADDITLFESIPDEQNEQGLEITSSGDEMDISGSESDVGLRQSTFGITPQPGQERTSDGRIKGAEGMQQLIAITSSEDEFTASGSKVSEYEYEWTSELPSDAEAAGTKMDKSRSQQAHGFNSSSVEEMTDLGEDRDEDRSEWTFSKHTHFRDDISTPRMSVPGAGHQQTITFQSEAEASGNKMTSGASQPLTGLTTIPEDEMSSSSNKMPASGSGWTIGLPSTEKPGTKQSTVKHKLTIGEPSDSGASGDKMAAAGQKLAIGITTDAKAFGSKMPTDRSQQHSALSTSTVDGENMSAAGSAWTIGLPSEAETPETNMFSVGHKWTIGRTPDEEEFGSKMPGGGSQQRSVLSTSTVDGENMSAAGSAWTIGLPSEAETPETNMFSVGHKWTIGRTPDEEEFGSKMPGGGSQQRSVLSTSTVDGENMSAAGSAWTIGLPSEAETPETNMFSVGHKWTIGRTPDEEEFGSKMPGGGSQQRSVLSTSTGDGTNMSSAESARTIGLPAEAEANRTNRFSAGHKWTIASHSEAAAFGEEISEAGHESTMGLPSVTDTSGKKMSTAGYKGTVRLPLDAEASGEELFAVEHKRAIGLPSDTDVSEGKMAAGGHKWKIETYSEGDVSGENMSGHKSTIQLTPDADAIRKKKSSAEHKWTVRSSSEAEASGNKLAGGKSQQLTGLSTSSVDEMTTTGKKISASGHKWAIGLPSEADVPKGKMAVGGHKWATGSYSEGDIPGEKMSGHKSTIQLTPEDEVARNKKSATGYHWTGGSSFDVEVSGNKLPGGESRQRTGLSTSNVDEMTTSGKKMAAAGHKWAIGSYSEGEASGELMAGGEHQQSSGLKFSSVHEITGEDMDSEGNKLTIGLPYHLNDKMTANGENTESVGSGQTPGLYFFPEDEMTALVERMGKAGRKQTGLSVHADGDNLSAGKKSNMGGKHISGATSYSGHGITAPGGNRSAEGSEWTVKFPSRSAKGMSEFSGQINGAEKIRFPEIKDSAEYSRLMKEFEEWLRVENSKLNKLRLTRTSNSDEDIDMRRKTLLILKSRVPEGQRLFETLRHYRPAMGVTEDLQMEDLRYRWMLYKSKLKDSDNTSSLEDLEEPVRLQKKPPGMCAFLHRVCCAALPLQLLLLLLLLLAFLLPLAEENHSCTLANNFARSFSLMLRYDKPPPT